MEINRIDINPGTPGEITFELGSANGVRIKGLLGNENPAVSDINIYVSDETRNPVIEIEVQGETYCIYENVPYVVFYKTSFHQ